MKSTDGIAIVGMDCRYPGAHTTEQYWENILSLRQQFRRIPTKRLNLDYYYAQDKSLVDHTYSQKASVLSGYHFDRVKYRVGKSTFEQTDMTHWLALDVAAGALKDAGFENGAGLDKKRVGVLMGNSLTGEFTRASIMRLRWPYVSQVLESTLAGLNYDREHISRILSDAESTYKKPFPEPTADTLAGGLSNTIAGRICNYFDFNGGGFTIDGACSSSLLSLANGCNSIVNGDLDVVLVGGVDLSIDPFEVIGFARNGALARYEMEVYSAKSEGFWPGEGCGIVVLMRESEAIERGLKIYSLVKGWGISSDGSGGITRPKPDTQQLAFDRAYKRAGYNIDSVTMFEGHGTGTPLGDQVEITALVNSLRSAGKKGEAAVLGSVKHLIGHTKAAAGIAGVIKAGLAIRNGIIPGSRPISSPNALLQENADLLVLGKTPKIWEGRTPLRASVSSMGFGGINVHVTMEEAGRTKRARTIPSKVVQLTRSLQDCEMFPVSAKTKEALVGKLQRLEELARDISRSEFTDVSASILASYEHEGPWKASIVAATPDALLTNLKLLREAIAEGSTRLTDVEKGIFFNATGRPGKIGFLFPGQGAPIYPGLGAFAPFSKEPAGSAGEAAGPDGEVVDTSVAQPAIVRSSLQSVQLLEHFGVEAQWGIGHSLGEISALSWAGAMDSEMAVEIARARGQAMSGLGEKGGAMLALKCTEPVLASLLTQEGVSITGYNGQGNYVVGGPADQINRVQQRAAEKGIQGVKLKVSHAFHTPMMKNAAEDFHNTLVKWEFDPLHTDVYSTVTGGKLHPEADLIDLLFKQIEAPVRLTQAVEHVQDDTDFMIEVGPGNALTRSLQGYKPFHGIALNYGANSLRGLLNALSAAYMAGNNVHFEELVFNRFYRKFDLESWQLDVLVNPCEATDFTTSIGQGIVPAAPAPAPAEAQQPAAAPVSETNASLEGVQRFLKNEISKKTEIPVEVISTEDRIMSQLHINSLALAEIILLVINHFKKSHMVFSEASMLAYADGSIGDLSKVIFEGAGSEVVQAEKGKMSFTAVPNWTHIFKRKSVTKKLPVVNGSSSTGKVIVRGAGPVAARWETYLAQENQLLGNGAVYVYASGSGAEVLHDFVQFLNQPEVRKGDFVALVNLRSGTLTGDLRPVLRTFQHEVSRLTAISLELDAALPDPEKILAAELPAASKYKEIVYDAGGQRSESELEVFFPAAGELSAALGSGDVLLATGGGKGITFESVLGLAGATGLKLAILGRAVPARDAELAANLRRLEEAGVAYRYYSADVCDAQSVGRAVAQAAADLGPIRALLHGAGINNPKPLAVLTPEDFANTLTVKLDGLRHVVEALDLSQLNLLIGFGSIIAESGMQGNADYAWANSQLALYLDELGARHPHCRCLALEWSVWDETGMGVALNRIETLRKAGVWPIPVKQGVDVLKAVVADPGCRGALIVSGRYGGIPTLNYTKPRLPLGRFISQVQHHVPGVEVVSEVNINLNDDIYLKYHIFKGQYVYPTVMILEGMAQVCSILTPNSPFWVFDDLKINKSIFIPEQGANQLRFIVTRIAEKRFKAVVQSEDSNFEINCFEATINFESEPSFTIETEEYTNIQDLNFNVEEKFYDNLLFHHGPFRRINSFCKIEALGSIAKAGSSLLDTWFSAFLPDTHLLGDPGLNDAAIHCHQACRPGNSLLPNGAGQIAINSREVQGPFIIRTFEIYEERNNTIVDVYVMNLKGEVKQYWKGLMLTQVAGTAFTGNWDAHLLVPYIEYNLMRLSRNRQVKLPLNQCFKLVNSLGTGSPLETYEVGGYSVSLKKRNGPGEETAFATGDALADPESQVTLELNMADLDQKVLLQISKLSDN